MKKIIFFIFFILFSIYSYSQQSLDNTDNIKQITAEAQNYYDGTKEFPKDYKKALDLFKKAADQGDAYCMYRVAYQYEYGQGVAQNYREAWAWYLKAAQLGHEESLNRLEALKKKAEEIKRENEKIRQENERIQQENERIAQENRRKKAEIEQNINEFKYQYGQMNNYLNQMQRNTTIRWNEPHQAAQCAKYAINNLRNIFKILGKNEYCLDRAYSKFMAVEAFGGSLSHDLYKPSKYNDYKRMLGCLQEAIDLLQECISELQN
ncbi:MAG: SEL1-like repeat protein [Candidatus Brocadiae bacterium]|nr:SEL1-like repeat protein [Candidatus Brocadiia bacterium]